MKDYADTHVSSDQFRVYGRQLQVGDILEETDVYASTSGRWELCPCPGVMLNTSLVIWVRPSKKRIK